MTFASHALNYILRITVANILVLANSFTWVAPSSVEPISFLQSISCRQHTWSVTREHFLLETTPYWGHTTTLPTLIGDSMRSTSTTAGSLPRYALADTPHADRT